nr:hypothetical protein L203_02882 [Cryptococcus depauperatus CBS 7841]
MSLYSGIKFSSVNPDQEKEKNTSTSNVATTVEAADIKSTTDSNSNKPKTTAEYSSALKFAPRINKKPAKPTAPTFSIPIVQRAAISCATESKPDVIRSAEPVINKSLLQPAEAQDGIQLGPDGTPLAMAPAMTLAAEAVKEGYKDKIGDKKKKKKKRKKPQQQQWMPTFDPEEQYDPNRPNDLGEYQHYRKQAKEDRRRKLIDSKRRGEGLSSNESSYCTDSEEDVAPRRDAPKMFAPPKAYSPPSSTVPLPPDDSHSQPSQSPAEHSIRSGDEVYEQRKVMSQNPVATGDDAYARRAAMSQQVSSQSQPRAISGNDAYTGRTAISQHLQPPGFVTEMSNPDPPAFAPPTFTATNFASPHPPNPTNGQTYDQSNSANGPSTSVPLSSIPGLAPAHPPTSNTPSGGSGQKDYQTMLEERKKAAEAIAAKFKALAGAGPATATATAIATPVVNPPTFGSDTADLGGGSFAEKMMRKWGHVEGTGLGARGEGIVHALSAEHVTTPVNPQNMSKRQLAKQKAAAANAKNRSWVQASNARGKIVNQNQDVNAQTQREQKGEESRIVCLRGLVGSVDEIEEEMVDEVGEECSKYGIVERVVLHMVEPPPPEPEECLRVFVVFSGMAGAWRALKELDGRYFGGRNITATYFDEERFNKGDRDGPIL